MASPAPQSFGVQLRALREAAGFTQEELATIAGLSVHAISALERGERRRPQFETVRSLCSALDLTAPTRDALLASARPTTHTATGDEPGRGWLPLAPTALVGRDAELETLRRWIRDPTARLITLVGPGGVGKTRLALEIARSLLDEGNARVVFVPLAAIREGSFVASAIAEAFGLTDVTAVDLPKRIRVVCEDRPATLVLDNFEHVMVGAPVVAELLTRVKPLRVFVTSREPLRLRGEREYAVQPLALNTNADATANATSSPAIQLFVDRVRDVAPHFQITAANIDAIAGICRRVDALPLAIELAAPWMKLLSADDLLLRLERDVLLSTVGPRDLPERQRTMNAAVAWSYQLLDHDDQRAFRRFGALPGLFPIDAATAVLAGRDGTSAETEDALRAVVGLVDKSLLVRSKASATPTRPFYYMLETVRAYAALQLTAAGERDDAMEGVVRYCAAEASLAEKGLAGPAQVDWLDRVRGNLETYRSALDWLIARGEAAQATHIAWALWWFWVIRGHITEALGWFDRILTVSSLTPPVEARALIGASAMRYGQGDLQRARDALLRARVLAQSLGDATSVAHADLVLGHVELGLGDLAAARVHFSASLERFTIGGPSWANGHLLTGLASVALATGDAAQAERLLDDAVPMLDGAGPWFSLFVLYVRGVIAARRGNAEEAIACARDSLTVIRDVGDTFSFLYALVPLATAAALKRDDAWVARIIGARDAVTERTGGRVADHSVDDLREQAERGARHRLGPDAWRRAHTVGRNQSIDSILADIDRARP
jgi:predicted ATPase/DNA-binding XRE family transcriptional regulator